MERSKCLPHRASHPTQCFSASHAQLSDMPLRSDTQALHFIARTPLILRREKCPSREEKSAFSQWFSSVYVRSLKDQVRKSKYPRTQILELRTQSKLFCHSSTTFIPTRSNKLIEVTLQSYIGINPKLHSFLHHPIQLYPRTYIGQPADQYRFTLPSHRDGFRPKGS